ncbi:MAG TPA: tetratricopeptide repeat protein, partial [Acetobacteraceae bacterium]|nr:tetratricopeptide repeat protein [Acetobacteraceae bacterium]
RGEEKAAAIDAYEATLAINPNRTEALLGIGATLLLAGEPARARPHLLRCCARAPEQAEAWDALGVAQLAAGDATAAEAAAAEAQRLRPDDTGFALRRVNAALAAGTAEAELARLTEAASRDPLNATLATARGVLLKALGRAEEAVAALEVATTLAPDAPLPAGALAEALQRTPHVQAAVAALRRAVALAPEDVALRNNLAAMLTRQHHLREAREVLEGLIGDHGEQPAFLCNLANALVLLGEQGAAVAMARRAAGLAPEMHAAWRTLGAVLVYAEEGTAEELRAIAERAGATVARRLPPGPPACGAEKRLRIGLLSNKLRMHPVGWLTIGAFEALDPRHFELVCLATPPGDDPMERRFRVAAAEWHDVSALEPGGIAERARALGIDILLDLGGWGDGGMLTACAERAAPVQIKWVGNQAYTTGLAEMDFFLTDRWETPEGFERYYTERLLRMPDGYVCYSPPVYLPDVAPSPAAARGHVTFGCFNTLAKITPTVIATWAAILRRVPEAKLVLKAYQFSDPVVAARIAACFAAEGIDASRLDLRGGTGHRAQLMQHADVDIILDPFPYAGGLTTCEALWLGVPVVTLAGGSFAGRHSASHLQNCGLADWVARDRQQYQEIAVARASDIAGLARLRRGLREQAAASPLGDAPRFAANLGALLRRVWREACAA